MSTMLMIRTINSTINLYIMKKKKEVNMGGLGWEGPLVT